MRTMVLGAGGIIGQHMYLLRPGEIYVKRTPAHHCWGGDLADRAVTIGLLDRERPRVIVNLAGENRVNFVDNGAFDDPVYRINVGLPVWLAEWCATNGGHLIQVSTQGVFSGDHPPYGPDDIPHPITAYGHQKAEAERRAIEASKPGGLTIVRVTFVLGVRPFPDMGRTNPLEAMFADGRQRQVNDRWFSPSIACDVAADLWDLADERPGGIIHLGIPITTCRYDIARIANSDATVTPVSDDSFPGPRRPLDTTWAEGSRRRMGLWDGIQLARKEWEKLHG